MDLEQHRLNTYNTFINQEQSNPQYFSRCFGVFACLVVLSNLLLLFLLLPSSFSLLLNYIPLSHTVFPLSNTLPSVFTGFLYRLRYVLLSAFVLLNVLSVICIFVRPGLRVPVTNSLQVSLLCTFLNFFSG